MQENCKRGRVRSEDYDLSNTTAIVVLAFGLGESRYAAHLRVLVLKIS